MSYFIFTLNHIEIKYKISHKLFNFFGLHLFMQNIQESKYSGTIYKKDKFILN